MNSDHDEVTIRLLQNGSYTWSISGKDKPATEATIARLKQLDGWLRETFPNHVKENRIRFSELSDE